jgi:hypothetical protein
LQGDLGGVGRSCSAGFVSTGDGSAALRRFRIEGWIVRRLNCLAGWLLMGLICGVVTPLYAESASVQPDRQDCDTAVAHARTLAAALPADDLSRYFAERDLHQALIEAGNGEFDDCLELAARAAEETRERRHTLPPGEKLKVLRADE